MAPVCGVEDPQLYIVDSPQAKLWQDAWDAARRSLPEEEITLVINPPTLRSQTHLHIHIVRGNGVPFPPGSVVALENLADAWWQQPNKAFEGKTPDSVFEEDPIKIYTYLVKSAEGDW